MYNLVLVVFGTAISTSLYILILVICGLVTFIHGSIFSIFQETQFKLNLIFILESHKSTHHILKQTLIEATIERLEQLLSHNVSAPDYSNKTFTASSCS